MSSMLERYTSALELVAAQAEDDMLWMVPETEAESELQIALRDLHMVIEGEDMAWFKANRRDRKGAEK